MEVFRIGDRSRGFLYSSVCLLQVLIFHLTRIEAVYRTISRTAILKQLLDPSNYDSNIPPRFNEDGPINVTIGMFVNNFDTINAQSMDYSVSLFLRMNWTDERLSFREHSIDESISLDPRILDQVWIPDLYFPDEKTAHLHEVIVPNRYLRISPDGAISFSIRVSLKLSCQMSLYKFPLDTQTCSIDMESYAYGLEKIRFEWTKSSDQPVEIPDIELPQFQLINHTIRSFVRHYSTGQFSALQVSFVLRRDVGFYMIHTYVPSVLIVILSWVSFWISADAVPARISLGVTTVLTMTTQSSGATSSLPRVSYVKAVDVWMFTCLLFVFLALLEFAVVNVLSRRRVKQQPPGEQTTEDSGNQNTKLQAILEQDGHVMDDNDFTTQRRESNSAALEEALRVDVISRYAFPVAFITFNSLYWSLYSIMSDPGLVDSTRN